MFLGIEIGGTKLQLGVGDGLSAELKELARADIVPQAGAAGILRQIDQIGNDLIARHNVERIGIGFGGPVNSSQGRVITSHQISGWDNYPLAEWCREKLGRPVVLGNDCDCATLGEAKFGAGRGKGSVFYVTVGTGVGGGFAQQGKLLGEGRPAASEIGHLRPGLRADHAQATVESLASGWGICGLARRCIRGELAHPSESLAFHSHGDEPVGAIAQPPAPSAVSQKYLDDLLQRCGGDPQQLTAQMVAQAAASGNALAQSVLAFACQVLGWAVAQVITLLAPEVVVIGGGVSLMGEQLFFAPVRREVARYVFPPLADNYAIEPAALGESVVVQGAVLLAASPT